MDEFNTSEVSPNEEINKKLRACFDGKIVRKDLTKSIKEGANVPVYVLEFLLGQYCSSDDPSVIEEGVANVKRILADNYVRPDEAQKILSVLRQRGSYTVIDKITVNLNIKKDTYEAEFSNLGISLFPSVKNIQASSTVCFVGVFGVLFSLNMNISRKIKVLHLFIYANLHLFRCRTLILKN